MSGSSLLGTDEIRELLTKISKLEENYRLKQVEYTTEVEKHKQTMSEMEELKREIALLLEEKIKLCEKIGSLTESCSVKEHSNQVMKKDIEKRMTELRVLERKLAEETEVYRKKREEFKKTLDDVNGQLHEVLGGIDDGKLMEEVRSLRRENEELRSKLQCNVHSEMQSHECPTELMDVENDVGQVSLVEKENTEVDVEKMGEDGELKELQREFAELTEYLNKLEASYNQSLSYIAGLEEIIGHCSQCSIARDQMLQKN